MSTFSDDEEHTFSSPVVQTLTTSTGNAESKTEVFEALNTGNTPIDSQSSETSNPPTPNTTPRKRAGFDFLEFVKSKRIKTEAPDRVDIGQLCPGIWKDKQLHFRVSHKGSRRKAQFGDMLSFRVMDSTGEISLSCFDKHVDTFENLLEVDKTFSLSGFKVSSSNQTISTGDTLRINPIAESVLQAVPDAGIAPLKFDFTGFDDIESKSKNTSIDVIGVLVQKDDVVQKEKVVQKGDQVQAESYVTYRKIYLADKTGKTLSATLWDKSAEEFEAENYSVIAFKNAKVNNFSGIGINSSKDTFMKVNPDLEEARQLGEDFQTAFKDAMEID